MKTGVFDQASVYTDLSAVHKLRSSDIDRDDAIHATARQFESYLTHMMMKSMRNVNAVFEEGNPFHSQGEKVFRDLFDHQLSLNMSNRQGMGLAKMLASQLGASPEKSVAQLSEQERFSLEEVSRLRINQPVRPMLQPLQTMPAQAQRALLEPQLAAPARDASSSPASTPTLPAAAPQSGPLRFDSPEGFVASVYPAAARVAEKLGVDPAVLVAQSALETGWGKHMIEGENGRPSYNLFGIKADSRWEGESVSIWTSEYEDGLRQSREADFRAYGSFEESFEDYLDFIQNQGRYASALAVAGDPAQYPQALQEAGYATDPAYAEKIQRIYDSETVQRARVAWMASGGSNRQGVDP